MVTADIARRRAAYYRHVMPSTSSGPTWRGRGARRREMGGQLGSDPISHELHAEMLDAALLGHAHVCAQHAACPGVISKAISKLGYLL